ncbi:thioredoxin family protein [Persephonella sp.]
MRDIVSFLLIVVGILFLLIGKTLASVKWYSYEDGLKAMKERKKMMIVYIHSDHCQYCRRMEETTFKSGAVINMLKENFIPVKVEKNSEEGLKVRKIYGYMGTPTFHFIKPNGEKVYSLFGAWEKKEFLDILKYFSEGHYKEKTLTEYFMK